MTLRFGTAEGEVEVAVTRALVAGWTGRDRQAVEHHIEELAELGVARPSAIPLYYRVAVGLLTQAEVVQVVGERSSGEVEPVVVVDDDGRQWLTVGSDHTDRELEAHSVALSKQICAKPVAREAWAFEEVSDRLDDLELRSWVRDDPEGEWTLYQEGTLAAIRPLPELVADAPGGIGAGGVMMCGTLPVVAGGVRPTREMRVELSDPDTDRAIRHAYAVEVLELAR